VRGTARSARAPDALLVAREVAVLPRFAMRPARVAGASGFTLFELLVVLSILAVLSVVVVPKLTDRSAVELESTARALASDLRRARSEAVTRNRSVALFVDRKAGRFGLLGDSARRRLPGSVHIELFTARSEPGAIRFFPDGSATGGRITVRARGRGFLLDVDWFTGRVRVTGFDRDEVTGHGFGSDSQI